MEEPAAKKQKSQATEDAVAAENADAKAPAPPVSGYLSRDCSAMEEEKAQVIRFQVISNDGKPEHMMWLIGLKNIYSQQLPNMPKEYIVRLVLDRYSAASRAVVCASSRAEVRVDAGTTSR